MIRTFRVEAVIYMKMYDGETEEEAEDRFLEQAEDAGLSVIAWGDTEILGDDE